MRLVNKIARFPGAQIELQTARGKMRQKEKERERERERERES